MPRGTIRLSLSLKIRGRSLTPYPVRFPSAKNAPLQHGTLGLFAFFFAIRITTFRRKSLRGIAFPLTIRTLLFRIANLSAAATRAMLRYFGSNRRYLGRNDDSFFNYVRYHWSNKPYGRLS